MSGVSLLGQLRCQHSYFANNRCPALQLQPSDACQAELARRQWRFRPSRDGGAVYALPGAEHSAHPGAPLLSFWLLRQDPWLDSYTAQATPVSSGLYYLDARLAHGQPGQLNPAGPLNAPRLPVSPTRFDWPVNPALQSAALALCPAIASPTGQADWGVPVWQALSPAAQLAQLPVALGPLAEGRYQFRVNQQPALDAWFGPVPAQAWGVVVMDASALQAAAPPDYQLMLEASSPQWRYHLLGTPPVPLAECQLLLRDAQTGQRLNFSASPEDTLFNRPSTLFTSPQGITLLAEPGSRYSVRLQSRQGSTHNLNLTLPYPAVDTLNPSSQGGSQVDAYVYF